MFLWRATQCVVEHDAPKVILLIRQDQPVRLFRDPCSQRVAWVMSVPGRTRSAVETMRFVHRMGNSRGSVFQRRPFLDLFR